MIPKLTQSQIKMIKEELQKNVEEFDAEEDLDTVDLAAVKKRYSYELNDDGTMHSDEKTINRQIKRKMLREARNTKKVSVAWNLEAGDTVQFKKNGTIVYGMIVKQSADGSYRNVSEAKYRGKVLVMCASGNIWMNPNKLEKLDD
jgi:flagellar hook protein FlgE